MKLDAKPNATPVAVINNAAMASSRAGAIRWPKIPTRIVVAAEPSSDAVTTAPICKPFSPSASKNPGKIT